MSFEKTKYKTEQKFLFLSEKDRQNLEKSSNKILTDLLRDFPEKLPDAIILPDTNARPLAYLFGPPLRKVAENRGIEPPKFYFFQTDVVDVVDILRRSGVSDAAKERARGIKKAIAKKNPKIIIMDDYASVRMRTIRDLREAFGWPLPAYVLLGNAEPGVYEKEDIKFGMEDPYLDGLLSYGFDFRRERYKKGINPTGVEKDEYGGIYSMPVIDPKIRKLSQDLKSDMKKNRGKPSVSILDLSFCHNLFLRLCNF